MLSHKLQTAIQGRTHLLTAETDALRLVDGSSDGFPGVFIDTFAGRRLVSTRSDQLDPELRECLKNQGHTCYWKRLDQHEKESPVHIAGKSQDEAFIARENGVNYRIHFQAGYSQGIFLDQRLNRKRVRDHSAAGKTILNTFAYTGAFSVCAALAAPPPPHLTYPRSTSTGHATIS